LKAKVTNVVVLTSTFGCLTDLEGSAPDCQGFFVATEAEVETTELVHRGRNLDGVLAVLGTLDLECFEEERDRFIVVAAIANVLANLVRQTSHLIFIYRAL